MHIVLKVLKKGSLASVLTYEHGKIIVRYRPARFYAQLMLGSLVEGDLVVDAARTHPFLNDVRLVSSVSLKGLRSQLFLHFILDAVYLFSPQGSPNTEVFILLQMMIEADLLALMEEHAALGPCLCAVLFDVLGFYPSFEISQLSAATQVFLNKYVMSLRNGELEHGASTLLPGLVLRYDSCRDTLRGWVAECMREHPQFKKNEFVWMSMLRNGMWG